MKKVRLFIFSLSILLQTQLLAVLNEIEQIYPVGSVITQDEFLERFEKNDFIRGGGESDVFKVTEKKTKKEYAIVIERSSVYSWFFDEKFASKTTKFFDRMINLQRYNPHQAAIHSFFWMKTKNVINDLSIDASFVNVIKCTKSEKFYDELTDDQCVLLPDDAEKEIFTKCLLLELGEADCTDNKYDDLKINYDLHNITTKLSTYFIHLAKIMETDNKRRNYIYVNSQNVFYGDRPMSDYQYWHYHLNGNDFYIPALPVVIKRIDYYPWFLKEEDSSYYNYFPKIDFTPYSMYNQKPEVSDDQILDILTYVPE